MGGYVEIILLAMVALFVGLRLFSVLGERTGHEQEMAPRPVDRRPELKPVPDPVPDSPASDDEAGESIVSPMADSGIRRIAAADRDFDPNGFILGAQSAYRMILEAFWRGEEEELRYLVGDDVREAFIGAIEQRKADGHEMQYELARIEHTVIEAAELDGHMARVTVRFDADVSGVTRDSDGNVVAGSLTDAVETHDTWTFARNIRDADPNWLLVETEEAA
ncbi:Tim44/TimA family putative adaptor protein [uncultured Parasphingopyxis sp.]|uniref:Tim44/TimA family putative adaptor protein n=1 Tax=uncultured Parasphingopyxis sp. TaxID=1547918 RepID=UPI002626AAC7|nr:Tim44/TimA family putative adaptor protein [uncultured Parasphingopyxis sp.]